MQIEDNGSDGLRKMENFNWSFLVQTQSGFQIRIYAIKIEIFQMMNLKFEFVQECFLGFLLEVNLLKEGMGNN